MIIYVHNYVSVGTINNSTPWLKLEQAVEEAKKNLPEGEELHVSFSYITVTEQNPYIAKVLTDDDIIIDCIKGNPTHRMLYSSALMLLRDHKKIANKFHFDVINTAKVLNKKEQAEQQKIKAYKAAISKELEEKAKTQKSLFCSFLKISEGCNLNNLRNICKDLPAFFETLKNLCAEWGITSIIVSMKNVDYNENLIDTFLKIAIRTFTAAGIKITFSDCTPLLNDKLRLHLKLAYNNGSVAEVEKFIRSLRLGRVVLLTKLKDHRSTDVKYREEDEVVAQYIAILNQISEREAEFYYTGFANLKTFHDLIAEYGSPDEFSELKMQRIVIPLEDLGCTDIRVARKWHLNLINGDVASDEKFNYIETYTGETIKAVKVPEKVVLPEFIRRSLRSWFISFNEPALLIDIQNYKNSLKKKGR